MINSFEVHALQYVVVQILESLQDLLRSAGHLSADKINLFNAFSARVVSQKTISDNILDITLTITPAGWPKGSIINLRLQLYGQIWSPIEGSIYYPSYKGKFIGFACSNGKATPGVGDESQGFFKPKQK